jgi:glycerophosphoryl diester phosphodiesterase
MQNREFIFIAHRGESYEAPENTLASINLAWHNDDDAVEIDVRMTKDKKIVAIHDNTTLRTGKRFMNVSSSNYDDLLKVDVGKFKGSKWVDEKIPILEEVIDTIPDGKSLFVEIKSKDNIVKPLQKLIEQKNINPKQIKFIGFSLETMSLVKKYLEEYETYWIVEKKTALKKIIIDDIILKCQSSKLNGLDMQEGKYLDYDLIQTVKNAGLMIYTWTVDDPVRAKQLISYGIDGITTNRAFWLRNQIQSKKVDRD